MKSQTVETGTFNPSVRLGRVRFMLLCAALVFVTYVFAMIVIGVATAIASTVGTLVSWVVIAMVFVLVVVIIVLQWILYVRRFHDVGLSGWWSLTMVIPLINFCVFLGLVLVPGTKGDNEWGSPPPRPSVFLTTVAVCLVLVLGILPVLASIALPMYNKFRLQSQAAEVLVNINIEVPPYDYSAEEIKNLRRLAASSGQDVCDLAQTYEEGAEAVNVDLKMAAGLYFVGWQQGKEQCMNQLSLMFLNGTGVDRNPEKAIQILEQSAGLGNGVAMYHLGRIYQEGIGVPIHVIKAKKWFEEAAQSGNIEAKEALENL